MLATHENFRLDSNLSTAKLLLSLSLFFDFIGVSLYFCFVSFLSFFFLYSFYVVCLFVCCGSWAKFQNKNNRNIMQLQTCLYPRWRTVTFSCRQANSKYEHKSCACGCDWCLLFEIQGWGLTRRHHPVWSWWKPWPGRWIGFWGLRIFLPFLHPLPLPVTSHMTRTLLCSVVVAVAESLATV